MKGLTAVSAATTMPARRDSNRAPADVRTSTVAVPSNAESERRPTSLVPNNPLQTLATPKYSGGDDCVRAMPCTMSTGAMRLRHGLRQPQRWQQNSR